MKKLLLSFAVLLSFSISAFPQYTTLSGIASTTILCFDSKTRLSSSYPSGCAVTTISGNHIHFKENNHYPVSVYTNTKVLAISAGDNVAGNHGSAINNY